MSEPDHLQHLNPEQLRAVTTLEGPLLVLAGAGSGKTRVLTRRIAHLLHTGVSARHILAVTFTNKAAGEMKARVIELVGEVGSKVWVSTFHSTCARILRHDIEPLGWTRRFSIYDDDDQVRVVRQIIADLGYDPKQVVARKILGRIDWYKNRGLGPDALLAQKRAGPPGQPLLRVWREYEEQLVAADAVDFNDLLLLTVRLFRERPDVLARWRERFQYVLVDEYQDTNATQYGLLRLLCSEHQNLAVVGDDDQSIYGFRGADVSNILNFQRDYPGAQLVKLEQNYRSSGNILTVSNHVAAQNEDRLEKTLRTDAPDGPLVMFLESRNPREEADRVARGVFNIHTHEGVAYGDFAIIYRTNATSRLFERALRDRGIPHRVVGGRKFYERREIRDLLAYLRLVTNPADDAAFLRVVNVPSRGIGAKTLAGLRKLATERGEPLLSTARATALGSSRREQALQAFVAIVDEAARLSSEVEPYELVKHVIQRSGYMAMLEAQDAEGKARQDNLRELVRDAAASALASELPAPLDRLQAWLDRVALAGQDEEIPEGGEVSLMTVHNAKGLEYPVVFVVQMVEGQFPHAKSLDDGIAEERRLAYVAFTRAKDRLVVTRSLESFTRDPRAAARPAAPSRFLYGLPDGPVGGVLPAAQPVAVISTRDVARQKLAAFLEHRGAPVEPELPDEELRTVEIESLEQLRPGERILHGRFGLGEIRRLVGSGPSTRLVVAFGGRSHTLPVRGLEAQIVVE